MSFSRIKYKFGNNLEMRAIITRERPGAYSMHVYVIYISMIKSQFMFNICLILLSNSMVPYNLIDSQGACSACRSTTTRRKGRSVREEGFKREVVRRWRDGSHSRKLSRMRFILKLRRTLNALSDDLQTSYKKFMVFAVRQTENR